MSKDLYIKARSANADEWVRPSDWLTMPTLTSSDDEFVGLYAIFPNGNNFATLTMTTSTGTYDVDWGDGTVDTVASGVLAQHTYDYATYDVSNTTLTSRGYKQAFITVTANTGLFRTANFQTRRVTSPVQNQAYATGFLDIVCSFPNFNTGASFTFGGLTIRHSYLERFDCKSIGNTTSLASLFSNCFNLQSIPLFNTSSVTSMTGMFINTQSIKTTPLFVTNSVTDMSNMFQNALGLITIPLYNTASVTNMTNMFQGAVSLVSVPLLNTSSVTLMSGMFQNCSSLKSVPLFVTSSVTTMSFMLTNCFNLTEIPLFNTASVTDMSSFVQGCSSLQSFPVLNTASVTNMTQMFFNAFSINSIPAISTASITTGAGTDFTNFCANARSIDRIQMVFARTVNISQCQLSQSALVEIFNNLVDRTATTSANINITGNWGASALTAGERLIATSKNWSITG